MLIDDDPARAASLEKHLLAAGYEVTAIITSTNAILFQIEQQKPDIVLIDLKFPGRDVLESMAVVNRHNPVPMLMFTEEDDPDYIQQAFTAGVSTYMMEGINPERVKPVIEVALAQFRAFQSLKNELHATRTALEDQTLLNRAKALLMKKKKLGEDAAHQLMLQMSMEHNLKSVEVARLVIRTLSPEKGAN